MRSWVLLLLVACAPSDVEDEAIDASRDDGKADGIFVGEDSPEQFGALRVANELDERALVREAHLGSRAAKGLLRFRAGRDAQAGTADDWRFESLDELDSVPYVGESTISKLAEHAADRGWIPAPPTLVSTTPADGATDINPCGTVELRFSTPLDPESVDSGADGSQVAVEGDRVLVTGFGQTRSPRIWLTGARAATGGPHAPGGVGLRLSLGAPRTPTITRVSPTGDGIALDGALLVSFCGIGDVTTVGLRLFDGGVEVPMRDPIDQSPTVWRRPLASLAPGHEYEAVATWSGGERRWRFRTTTHAWRRELLDVIARSRFHASPDGTLVHFVPDGAIDVGRLGGAWARVPGNGRTIAAFAQDGGGVRAVWNTSDGVSAGGWTPGAGWNQAQIGIGVGIGGFLDATWAVHEQEGNAYVARLEGTGWLSERLDTTTAVWPQIQNLVQTEDGRLWMLWNDRDRDDAYVSRRTTNGWTRHNLIPGHDGGAQIALGGADELHVIVDSGLFGLVSWRLDRDSRDLPQRRLGGGGIFTPARARVVVDSEGNLLVLWGSRVGGWARWYRSDLGAWTAREPFPAGSISSAAAAPDGAIYVVADGGLWRGTVDHSWERLADSPGGQVAVLAGQVTVHDDRGMLWTLTP